jgi:hypothetical protein
LSRATALAAAPDAPLPKAGAIFNPFRKSFFEKPICAPHPWQSLKRETFSAAAVSVIRSFPD